jgi:hypothetical protein
VGECRGAAVTMGGRFIKESGVFEGALSGGCTLYTSILLMMVTWSPPCCCVSRLDGMEKNTLSVVMVFNVCVFNALHLYLHKYVAEIPLPDNNIQQISNSK